MIHYTCDRCKRAIDPETESRYIVEIDVRSADAIEITDEDPEEVDQLAELHDQLERELTCELNCLPASQLDQSIDQIDQTLKACDAESIPEQYDLCEQCHQAFISNPLGREVAVAIPFSNN